MVTLHLDQLFNPVHPVTTQMLMQAQHKEKRSEKQKEGAPIKSYTLAGSCSRNWLWRFYKRFFYPVLTLHFPVFPVIEI